MAGVDKRVLGLTLQRDGEHCLLRVADSGGGIASEHLGHVFEPFFTTKPVGQGLGLGLAVSYGIVRELGGSLEAANQGEGALFTLRLPLATAS
jgi:two-component system, NtrC family, C4-dicarboxylate transport sensor histidine kinase DctB